MILEYKHSRIYYTDTGEGFPIILLHGFLETSTMWQDFIPEFSRNNRVVCIDLLGHGQTDCIGYVHTMENMADAVIGVLKHLQIDNAKLVGHSMGGYVALALAEKAPQLVHGLCLMNSTFEADSQERQLMRTRAIEMAHGNYENLVRISFANLFAPESRIDFKPEFEDALNIALNTPVQGYIAAQEGMKLRANRLKVFKNVNGDKLLIVGKKDSLVNRESLNAHIRDSDIEYVELSAGHMSHIENKSDLSYFLLRFIEK